MSNLNNVALWFAKDKDNNIVTIDKINKEEVNTYTCPLCGSEVLPRAIDSEHMSPHFYHIDKSKCSGESIVHWWVKNELIKCGEKIEVITNKVETIICSNIYLEKEYLTPYGVYKPDISVEGENGKVIFIEVNYTNKKNNSDFIKKWKYLNNVVVEFNIKNVYDEETNQISISKTMNAIYYDGINIDKNSSEYIKYRKSTTNGFDKESVNKISWFIDDIYEYNKGIKDDLNELTNSFIFLAKDISNRDILEHLYRNSKCGTVLKEIIINRDELLKNVADRVKYRNIYYSQSSTERKIFNRLFGHPTHIKIPVSSILSNIKENKIYFTDIKWMGYNYCTWGGNSIERSYDDETIEIDIFYDNINDIIDMKLLAIENKYINIIEKCMLLKNILNMYRNDTSIELDPEYICFNVDKAEFKISHITGNISINGLNICNSDIYNIDNFVEDINIAINYIRPTGDCILSKRMIDIHKKLSDRYSKIPNEYYVIKSNLRKMSLYNCGTEIATVDYNEKTEFEYITKIFSKGIRDNLYGSEVNKDGN